MLNYYRLLTLLSLIGENSNTERRQSAKNTPLLNETIKNPPEQTAKTVTCRGYYNRSERVLSVYLQQRAAGSSPGPPHASG